MFNLQVEIFYSKSCYNFGRVLFPAVYYTPGYRLLLGLLRFVTSYGIIELQHAAYNQQQTIHELHKTTAIQSEKGEKAL